MLEVWQQQIFMGLLVVVVFTAFVKEWLPVEIVSLGALFACIASGMLPVAPSEPALIPFDALRVFAHPAPITIACMFVLSAALDRTGVIDAIGVQFERLAATSPLRMLVVLMVFVAILSCFMNNTPVVVVFMPIVLGICRKKEWRASRFLIPLSYAAIVGGTLTIIGTSTNLIAAGIAREHGLRAFTMFEIFPLGIVFVVVTLAYMITLGRRLLPDRITLATLFDSSETREFITHAVIREGSPLAGKRFAGSRLSKLRRARVLEVVRNGRRLTIPLTDIVFKEGDQITFKGNVEGLIGISRDPDIPSRGDEDLGLGGARTESALLMEGIIGPESTMEGKSLKELRFRQRYGVIVLAVHRRGQNLREHFEDAKLTFGDTLLVSGSAEKLRRLFEQRDFINLSEPKTTELRPRRAPMAIGATLAFMVIGALIGFGLFPDVPVVVLAMGAALLVLVTGCIDPKDAYAAIEWRVLFMIFGMLGVGLAMERCGLDAVLAERTVALVGDRPLLLVAGIYLVTALLTEIISNNAVAALMTPLAIVVAAEAGFEDPRALVVAVMFGASASFSTPIGYQTNTFVYGAGGYKFSDFLRVGAPLAVILWIVASLLIPVIWPV